jgi:MFS family permease
VTTQANETPETRTFQGRTPAPPPEEIVVESTADQTVAEVLDTTEPPPRTSRFASLKAMFSSLSERNYRLFAAGQIVSNVGTWMQRVAQDWLVLELSARSPMALGVATALQFAPTLVLSAWAGMLADRMDKRKLEVVVQAGMGASALVLGMLVVTNSAALWQVYLMCFLLGCFAAIDQPVRQSFVMEMVGKPQLPNAVALNSMTFNLARIVGPAIAGVLINLIGTGWVFLLNAGTFVAVITGLLMMDPSKLYRGPKAPRKRGQLIEGIRYVRGKPDILIVLVLIFCVSTFAMNFQVTLANVAANVFHRNATGYGLLTTLIAVGTLFGATLAARRSARGRPTRRMLIGGALVFGALEAGLTFMPSYLTFGLMLIPVGAAMLTFSVTANSSVQLAASPEMRGRVMGLYMLVFLGGNPIAGPFTGWLAEEFGGRSPFLVGGGLAVLAALVLAVIVRTRRPVLTEPALTS